MKQFQKTLNTLKKRTRPLVAKVARIIIKTPLPEIAFVSCLIFSKYLRNADFQYPSEIVIPIILFALIATVFFYAYRLVLKNWFSARIATLAMLYALYSFNYLTPWLRAIGHVLLPKHFETTFANASMTVLIMTVIAGVLAYAIHLAIKHITFIRHLQLHRIVLFALLFIFVIQGYKVGSKLVTIHSQLTYKYPTPSYKQDKSKITSKPDVYYFVFDRYASASTLKTDYNFDNSGLMDSLSGMGFVNRLDAKANYPFTMQSISSTLAMNYHTDLEKQFGKDSFQTAFPYRSILNNPPVAQELKQNGYQYNQVSSWWDFTRVGIQADTNPTESFRLRIFGKSFFMSDLSRDIINKSILSQWLKKGLTFGKHPAIKYDLDKNPRENFFDQEAAIRNIAGQTHAAPQFTFAHFLAPHDPYIFEANGSDPTYDGGRNDYGEDETAKYTEEVTYLNTQIVSMMGYIRQHSPNAVIVIQSDEGPYPKQFRFNLAPGHYYDPADLPLTQEQQKFGVLASYYMPDVDAATVQQDIVASVDPFRFVLQHYLGYDISMLPDCQFATGDKYVIYDFKNETPKLQTTPPTACGSL